MDGNKITIEEVVDDYLQRLKFYDLLKKKEPEKFELLKEAAEGMTDIQFSRVIENIAISVDKNKRTFSKITIKARKRIFIEEQIDLYSNACRRLERFGDYSNATFDKYEPVFIEALQYWKNELLNLDTLPHPQPIAEKHNFDEYCYIGALFAQGFIKKDKTIFYFKDEEFTIQKHLIERIQKEILEVFNKKIPANSLRFYVSATLSGKDSEKNFYTNKNLHSNTIKFCSSRDLTVTEKFRLSIKH